MFVLCVHFLDSRSAQHNSRLGCIMPQSVALLSMEELKFLPFTSSPSGRTPPRCPALRKWLNPPTPPGCFPPPVSLWILSSPLHVVSVSRDCFGRLRSYHNTSVPSTTFTAVMCQQSIAWGVGWENVDLGLSEVQKQMFCVLAKGWQV